MNKRDDAYYQTAEDWHSEVVLKQRSQLKIAYVIAGLSLLLASLCAFAIASIAPIKSVVPYVIEVDRTTGEANVLKQYTGEIQKLSIEEVLSKYWINRYLIARESFSPKTDMEENYNTVRYLSEGKALDNYAKRFADDNPENPFKKYADGRVTVEVKSISFLRKDTATIRYELVQTSTDKETRSHWIDVINYHYTNMPSDESQRLTNPLGFKVTEFRSDREVIK